MPWKYDPKDASPCWPDGDYEAILHSADETTSKSGNPMLVLTFEVYHPDNQRSIKIDDYIVKATTFKLQRFAKALGKLDEFKAGTFDATMYLQAGVILTLRTDSSPGYDDKNAIDGYKPLERAPSQRPYTGTSKDSEMTEADIPF